MTHYYLDKQSDETLILLHGTGADEHDLVPLATSVAPNANILSLRGRVSENGMLRFFKRFDMHTFDQESIDTESDAVLKFIKEAQTKYKLGNLTLLGYSNGASMIEALLTKDNKRFTKAVLLQPGLIREDLVFPVNKELAVFASISDIDPYLTIANQKALLKALNESFTLSITRHNNGHGLTNEVLHDVYKFLNN